MERAISKTNIFISSTAQRRWTLFVIKMERTTGQHYSDSVSYLRKRLRFELLRTSDIHTGRQRKEEEGKPRHSLSA